MELTPGRQMGWPDLFEAHPRTCAGRDNSRFMMPPAASVGSWTSYFVIRSQASALRWSRHPRRPRRHHDCQKMSRDDQIFLFRFDISAPLPVGEPFDFVICRASIHHTPDPARTFDSLVRAVGPQGHLAITAYAKKGRLRELNDDALRDAFAQTVKCRMECEWRTSSPRWARRSKQVSETVKIERDLEWLGIRCWRIWCPAARLRCAFSSVGTIQNLAMSYRALSISIGIIRPSPIDTSARCCGIGS